MTGPKSDELFIGVPVKDFLAVTVHPVERVIRVLVGLALLSLVFIGPKTSWGWIGVLPLLSGLSGICPLYSVLGISTCPKKAAS